MLNEEDVVGGYERGPGEEETARVEGEKAGCRTSGGEFDRCDIDRVKVRVGGGSGRRGRDGKVEDLDSSFVPSCEVEEGTLWVELREIVIR